MTYDFLDIVNNRLKLIKVIYNKFNMLIISLMNIWSLIYLSLYFEIL